ncbi:PLP-dependent transferase [Hyaloscypha variabilis F]|uniref:PLP-dependent transferase n=1 Tax=Hyaloscypha variabilis (strain UAMH 11265 / GT02V1 / F) TaxID=1149755 RepID=A0A2J6R0R4_HYAVF|nr:PLP-dependent transferase [Hyaloscypha variabilis F]
MEYNTDVEEFQDIEYPMLQGSTYLDHGGATIYAKSLVDTFAADLVSNLYGNPHSANAPAKLSGQLVDETREKTLRFLGADPEHFDLVFVANATAAIKLVMESFKDLSTTNKLVEGDEGGFRYFYHIDCHNSVIGVRETTDDDHYCFRDDAEVEQWLDGKTSQNEGSKLGLFAYPGQSNMTGRRLPLSWPGMLRRSSHISHQDTYSLLDAAALATSYPLHKVFSNPESAPDFTSLSFYKIFGYPDLGALIVRKASGRILQWGRKYFGGGTVDAVTVLGKKPFFKNRGVLHESLEDGTLPFHNIIALNAAIDTHERIYGPDPMTTISRHTSFLGKMLYDRMSALVHPNGVPVCKIYTSTQSTYGDSTTQGATIAFNVVLADGTFAPYTSVVETLADERKIYVRSGQLCNPGGIASNLGYNTWHLKRLVANGHRCGAAHITNTEIVNGKPTGVVRVSLGAMTTIANIDSLITFLEEEFIQKNTQPLEATSDSQDFSIPIRASSRDQTPRLYIENVDRQDNYNSNNREDSQDSSSVSSYPVSAPSLTGDSRTSTCPSSVSGTRDSTWSNLHMFNDSAVQMGKPMETLQVENEKKGLKRLFHKKGRKIAAN